MRQERESHFFFFAKCSYELEAMDICSQPCLIFGTQQISSENTYSPLHGEERTDTIALFTLFLDTYQSYSGFLRRSNRTKKMTRVSLSCCVLNESCSFSLDISHQNIFRTPGSLLPDCQRYLLRTICQDTNIIYARQISKLFKLLAASKNANFSNNYMPSLPKMLALPSKSSGSFS